MTNYSNCVAGCKHFAEGIVFHHRDCPNYPDSINKEFDEMKAELKKYKKEKRSPLPDGTLELTEEELKEFISKVNLGKYNTVEDVRLVKLQYRQIKIDVNSVFYACTEVDAIAYLLERFNLEV